jgi:DNA-binding beta-propeller fold protein YncE
VSIIPELVVTHDGTRVLIGDGSKVLFLDADNLAVLDTVDLVYGVSWLTVNSAGTELYVSTDHGIGIVDVSACSLRVFSQAVGNGWVQALSYDEQLLYASNKADSGLTVLRASDLAVTGHINIHQDGVMDIAPSPDGYYLYLSYVGLHVLDLRSMSLVDSIAFPSHGRIYVHPSGDSLYYAEGRTVHVIGKR